MSVLREKLTLGTITLIEKRRIERLSRRTNFLRTTGLKGKREES